MTAALKGRLYYEALGPSDAPPMLFVHPNPMDSSCWLFQMAQLPDAELITLGGAGHACHMKQPWAFDEQVMGFLRRRGVCPVS